jgi:hypothetical protein
MASADDLRLDRPRGSDSASAMEDRLDLGIRRSLHIAQPRAQASVTTQNLILRFKKIPQRFQIRISLNHNFLTFEVTSPKLNTFLIKENYSYNIFGNI